MPFGLTFLAPIAGLIAAGIAVPALLSLYFLKLRRRPVRVSSTLLWRSAIKDMQVNTPFRWLRFNWNLLLQLLILALLLLAIARPAIELDQQTPDKLIVLIDRSASMSANDAGTPSEPRSRLEQAKRLAKELVRRATSEGTEVMLITSASNAVTRVNFTSNRGELTNAIDEIAPSDQPGNPNAALRLAEASLLQSGEESGISAGVTLFSDGQPSTTPLERPLSLGAASFTFIRVGPEPGEPLDNVGIVSISARRDYDDPATVRLFARLASTVGTEVGLPLRIMFGEQMLVEETVVVPPSGEFAYTADLPIDVGGPLTLTLDRTDDLAADNTASLVLAPPGGVSIAIVQPAPPETASQYALVDAIAAIEPERLELWSAAEFEDAIRSGPLAGEFDLIVFDRVTPSIAPSLPTLSFAAGLPLDGLEVTQPEAAQGRSVRVAIWQRTHPLLRYASLDDVTIGSPFVIRQTTEDAPIQLDALATTSLGTAIALVEDAAARRIVVGIPLASSNWWRVISFPVFIDNAIDFLTRAAGSGVEPAFQTGEAIAIDGLASGNALVAGPWGERPFSVPTTGSLALPPLDRVGIYTVSTTSEDRPVAVNLVSPLESSIATSASVDLGSQQAVGTRLSAVVPAELWRWLVALAALLTTLEWWLYARRMRIV